MCVNNKNVILSTLFFVFFFCALFNLVTACTTIVVLKRNANVQYNMYRYISSNTDILLAAGLYETVHFIYKSV